MSKSEYRQLCEEERSIPLFHQAWWLDATCGCEGWGVALVGKGGEIQASLPYRPVRRSGFTLLGQPALTPFLGPWMRRTTSRATYEYGRQKELLTGLIDSLPAHDSYAQSWSPQVTNWLPFFWRGFEQTTRYTYVLEGPSNSTTLWKSFDQRVRNDVRRAETRSGLTVTSDVTLSEFLALNTSSFQRQRRARGYSDELVQSLDTACSARACRRIFIAKDDAGRAHAGAYIVWDAYSAYYLMGGVDPGRLGNGAMSLCLWEAIRFSSAVAPRFDFEGSMVESIERFFRGFGCSQVPYFRITRTPSRLLRTLRSAGAFLQEIGHARAGAHPRDRSQFKQE